MEWSVVCVINDNEVRYQLIQRVRVSPQVPRSNLGRDSGSTEERSRTITFAVLPET